VWLFKIGREGGYPALELLWARGYLRAPQGEEADSDRGHMFGRLFHKVRAREELVERIKERVEMRLSWTQNL